MTNEIKILLVINKLNRELPVMEAIKREILAIKPEAIVEIREQFAPGFNFPKLVFSFNPSVILTFPFKPIGFSHWYYVFKFFLGIKIISFPTEGVLNFSSERWVEGACGLDKYGKTLVDNELFWGEWTAKNSAKHLLVQGKISCEERVKVCGYPRLEPYFNNDSQQKPLLPERILHEISGFSKKQIVLFITGFQIANYTDQDFVNAQDLNMEKYPHVFLSAREMAKRFRLKWIENVKKTALENPEILIVCKKHPIEKMEDYDEYADIDNILYIYEDIQVNDIVPYAGIFFHYGSTTLVDSYLSQIPSISVSTDESSEWYSDPGWPSSDKIDVEEIPETVKKFLAGGISFEFTPEIAQVLKDIFNIELDKPYKPSKDIAKIVLDLQPPQKIQLIDPYLWKALWVVFILLPVSRRFANVSDRISSVTKRARKR
jgi:surface carbohydrate biosynthesis protein